MAKLTEAQAQRQQNAITDLKSILKPGDRITCTVLNVSRSGMSRTIMLQVLDNRSGAPEILDISADVARAIGANIGNDGGVKMTGCGMDMRFEAVYLLGRALFPEGFAPCTDFQREDDFKTHGPRLSKFEVQCLIADGYTPVCTGRNGNTSGWDDNGGYALKQA